MSEEAAPVEGAVEPAEEPVEEPVEYAQQSLLPPTSTGDVRVDAALAGLDDLSQVPVHEHIEAYERVHNQMARALGDADQA